MEVNCFGEKELNTSIGPIHYRYEIEEGVSEICLSLSTQLNIKVKLQSFAVMAETPAGYWLTYCGCCKDRWVSKYSMKRWAYPSKQEAIVNFLKRKEKHINIMKHQLEKTETAIPIAQRILDDIVLF